MSAPLTPAQRLDRSRFQLRLALRRSASPLASAPPAGVPAELLLQGLRVWWRQHPWRVTGLVAADALKSAVRPVAQRHPLALVLGSFAAGGLLAWLRPWRLVPAPVVLGALLPELVAAASAPLPPGGWVELLGALAKLLPQANAAPDAAASQRASAGPAQSQ